MLKYSSCFGVNQSLRANGKCWESPDYPVSSSSVLFSANGITYCPSSSSAPVMMWYYSVHACKEAGVLSLRQALWGHLVAWKNIGQRQWACHSVWHMDKTSSSTWGPPLCQVSREKPWNQTGKKNIETTIMWHRVALLHYSVWPYSPYKLSCVTTLLLLLQKQILTGWFSCWGGILNQSHH